MKRVIGCLGFTLVFLAMLAPVYTVEQAQKGVHPVIDAHEGYLFGGTVDGKWVDSEKLASRVKGKETYRLYTLTKCLGTATGGKAILQGEDEGGYSSPSVDVTPASGVKIEDYTIGVCGAWNALPRVPRPQDVRQQAYREVVDQYLITRGLRNARINITRILRVDLEGDGTDEVLISATTPRQPEGMLGGKQGDYSLVLLRKIIKGKVQTIRIDGDVSTADNTTIEFDTHLLEGVLDVNGDGVLEVIARYSYHEGSGRIIYQVAGTNITQVLEAGAGV